MNNFEGRKENITAYANRILEPFYLRNYKWNPDKTKTYLDTANYDFTSSIKDKDNQEITTFDIEKIVLAETGWIGCSWNLTKATLLLDNVYTYDINRVNKYDPEDVAVIQYGSIFIIRNVRHHEPPAP